MQISGAFKMPVNMTRGSSSVMGLAGLLMPYTILRCLTIGYSMWVS